jgi:hypothetical protein
MFQILCVCSSDGPEASAPHAIVNRALGNMIHLDSLQICDSGFPRFQNTWHKM